MVTCPDMLVNKESTSCETYSSSGLRDVWFFIIVANVWVSLILYSFSHKDLRYGDIMCMFLSVILLDGISDYLY